MTQLRVHCFTVSVDGYAAGPNQNVGDPFGTGGLVLHDWMFATHTLHQMQFQFVTDGIHSAYEQAVAAAGTNDVRLGGGAAVVREYLNAGLVDHMHLAITGVLLGSGESVLAGVDLRALGYRCDEYVPSTAVTHVLLIGRA